VIQLKILSDKMAGTVVVARHFPFRIGRSAAANLRIEDAGIWDEHLILSLNVVGQIEATVQPGALATVNAQSVDHARLQNGDVIQIGAVQLAFELSPARRRSFWAREGLVWTGLALLCLAQVALIYWLLN